MMAADGVASSSVLGRPGFEMENIAQVAPNLVVNTSVNVMEEEEDVDINASWGFNNMTEQNVAMDLEILQKIVPILVPVLFSIIIITGFIGNLLVVCVVTLNKNMMNTTNLLILNLAVRENTHRNYYLIEDWISEKSENGKSQYPGWR